MSVPGMSAVRIANMALSHCGADNVIESLTEDSLEAKQCKMFYDIARQMALAGHNWSFARKRLVLSEHADDPPDDWAYRYQYPADCVIMRRLLNPAGDEADAVPYSLVVDDTGEAKCILTDLEEAEAEYTFDLTKVALFSPHFISTFSHFLGYLIAPAITGDKEKAAELFNAAQFMLQTAGAHDENEEAKKKEREGSSIRARW